MIRIIDFTIGTIFGNKTAKLTNEKFKLFKSHVFFCRKLFWLCSKNKQTRSMTREKIDTEKINYNPLWIVIANRIWSIKSIEIIRFVIGEEKKKNHNKLNERKNKVSQKSIESKREWKRNKEIEKKNFKNF